jgi:hypothetical protein
MRGRANLPELLASVPEKISARRKASVLFPAEEQPEMAIVKGCCCAAISRPSERERWATGKN